MEVIGLDGLKQSMSRHIAGFPDLHVTIDDILAEGNKVGIGFDLLTIESGRISKGRFISDLFGLLHQLGATVSPPKTPRGL